MQSEARIIDDCERWDHLYEDSQFPLTSACSIPGASWQRPMQALGAAVRLFAREGLGTSAFVLGSARLVTNWLLDALSALAIHPTHVERLFVSTRGSRYGVYTLQLFVGEQWMQITMDDRLPCNENGELLYTRSGFEGELWVSLVEKAFAKLLGGYDQLRHGSISDALRALTGGIPVSMAIETNPPAAGSTALPPARWDAVLERVSEGAPVLLYRECHPARKVEVRHLVQRFPTTHEDLFHAFVRAAPPQPSVERPGHMCVRSSETRTLQVDTTLTEGEQGKLLVGFGYPVLQARLKGSRRFVQLGFPWRPLPPALSRSADPGLPSRVEWIAWDEVC